MQISEVVVKLAGPDDPGRPRLLAYATVAFDDCLVVHDLKVIEGRDGLFVAMPSKPAPVRCECGKKCTAQETHCPTCRQPLPQLERGRRFLDIAHPIRHSFRAELEKAVLDEFKLLGPEKPV